MQPGNLWFIEVGKLYYFPTIGPAYVGKVKEISPVAVRLEANSVWVRNTGNVTDMLTNGTVQEAFRIPAEVTIPFSVCQPWIEWNHAIPRV